MSIYLDHSATTPLDEKVLKAMTPYFNKKFGNPSSIHSFGQEAFAGVDKAREKAAKFFNCDSQEIIFTSGATEADNLALKGIIKAMVKKWPKEKGKMHVITSVVEHDAILEPCLALEKESVEVTFLPVKKNGTVDTEILKASIKENTVLVSIMWVNSEVGAVMPIREIGKTIKKINDKKLNDWKKMRLRDRGEKPNIIYFHTDATQAVNFLNCDVKWNYIDLLSMSGHKIYGPKGVGLLYKKEGVPLEAIQQGGHHENNLRSGTLNVTGMVGLGEALAQLGPRKEKGEPSKKQTAQNKKIEKLRDKLIDGVKKEIPDFVLNTDRKISTPAHAHFSFLGVEGESSLIALDLEGIAVSTGSACASSSLKSSHVLLAMGIDKEVAHYSVRFSLGKHNTKEEIDTVIKKLPAIIKRLRKMNPVYNK